MLEIKKKLRKVFVLTVIMALVVQSFVWPVFAMGESNTIAAGWGTTFYITDDGKLWGYGSTDEDLILNATSDYVDEPVLQMTDVKSVAVNRYAVVVIKRDNSLWYWGRLPEFDKVVTPTKIMDDVAYAAIDGGNNQSLMVLKVDGTLYLNDSTHDMAPIVHSAKIKTIAIGGYNRFFIDENNELWGFSANKSGADSSLGLGTSEVVMEPRLIATDVQSVASGNSNTMILKKDGTLWMCGEGFDGKMYTFDGLIDGPVTLPVKVMEKVIQVAIGSGSPYFYAIKSDKTLWTWGKNDMSSLGSSYLDAPIKWSENVTNMTVGYQHRVLTKSDLTLWTAGRKEGVYHASSSTNNPLTFTAEKLLDTPATWALSEVREAEYRKLVPPSLQSHYDQVVNRSEFCTLAVICVEQSMKMSIENYLSSKNIELPKVSPFEDIKGLSSDSQKDILAAYALGIVKGTSETTFEPIKPITREEAATMLTNAAVAMNQNTQATMPVFADDSEISGWARPFIGYIVNVKIMNGVGNNKFGPKEGYQRQQAYMTVLRLNKLVEGAN
ncbi:MAG: S-layer homology domain-containing protein [Clostridia bacterium]|nr:S-layer homology domain-containing protein [Clostridia bacterium]